MYVDGKRNMNPLWSGEEREACIGLEEMSILFACENP